MPSIEIPFACGVPIWRVVSASGQSEQDCPDCGGSGIVTVIFHNNSTHTVACEGCKREYCSTGKLKTWEPFFTVKEFTPGKVHEFGEDCVYYVDASFQGSGSLYSSKDMFHTKEEAEKEANRRTVEARSIDKQHRFECTIDKIKKYAWSASYHQRHIRELKTQIGYHEARLAEIDLRKKKRE